MRFYRRCRKSFERRCDQMSAHDFEQWWNDSRYGGMTPVLLGNAFREVALAAWDAALVAQAIATPPRRFTEAEREALAHLANDEADFFEVDSDGEETAKHRAVVWAMLAESSESGVN